MWWALLRKFPKYALVAAVLSVSTGLFAFWWFTRSPKKQAAKVAQQAEVQADTTQRAARAESKIGKLLLVDNDLYDLDTGEIIFKNWLSKGVPQRIGYEEGKTTLLAQYAQGLVRYRWDGSVIAALELRFPLVLTPDESAVLFVKEKDVWRADLDWSALKLTNERPVTTIRQFLDVHFAANILLHTAKTLVVRNLNTLLRVNLETGEVHPIRFGLMNIAKQRSPDHRSLLAVDRGQLACLDVDTDTTQAVPFGKAAVQDYLWLDANRCAVLAEARNVFIYDRSKNQLEKLVTLPEPCGNLELPSPDARFVFASGRGRGTLVDLEKRTTQAVIGGQGVGWVSEDSFIFSREIPDSTLRGTWRQKVGEAEQRISPEPFIVSRAGASILPVKSANAILLMTTQGLMRMKSDGTEIAHVAKLPRSPSHLNSIEGWRAK
jgi:hypothetical protein